MRFAIVVHQLIGPHVNGSQVACWAIARHLLNEGHEVYVCSMLDEGTAAASMGEIAQLEGIGARFQPIVYDRSIFKPGHSAQKPAVLEKLRNLLCLGKMESHIPWLKIRSVAGARLTAIQPDAVLCYDFPSLAATFGIHVAPKMAVVVDLWHLVVLLRWTEKKRDQTLVTRLKQGVQIRRLVGLHKKLMMDVLADCDSQVEFAFHHAKWLRERGLTEIIYLQTPVEDPMPDCAELILDAPAERSKPRILMIGDLTNVATRLGMELFAAEVLPELERRLGPEGFEVRVAGGGQLSPRLAQALRRPSVRMIGRVSPPHSEFLSADIVLVPTPSEIGMRVRIAAAFGYGCCVVAHTANAAGIPEIQHGYNALLGESGRELALQVERAWRNAQLRRTIEGNARITFEELFCAERAAARVANHLIQLTTHRKMGS